MRFTKRDMEMIGYLKDYDEVDLSAMSEFLEVSVKTLRNQLKSLAEAMEEYGVSIQFLSGSRVRIQGHEKFIFRISPISFWSASPTRRSSYPPS